jgi:hypothetical protein
MSLSGVTAVSVPGMGMHMGMPGMDMSLVSHVNVAMPHPRGCSQDGE